MSTLVIPGRREAANPELSLRLPTYLLDTSGNPLLSGAER